MLANHLNQQLTLISISLRRGEICFVAGATTGHAIGSGTYDSNAIQKALIEEAKEKGADAVLITGIDNQDNGHESEVTASFLKYK